MYSVHQNVQILMALLKKYGIKDLVISAGTRHIPLVFSAEEDEFFRCYSIVDERSAGFFALGLIEKQKCPVAVICTSGTAAANYVSAANEAYYQHLPLVILTSDRHPYYLNQQEDQMIPQLGLYKEACKKAVSLPIVRDNKDYWYCSRLVNEALLELNHRESGPVHINFPIDDNYPIEQGTFKFNLPQLPDVVKIDRLMLEDSAEQWRKKAEELKNAKVLIIYGQHGKLKEKAKTAFESFCKKYDCMVSVDHLSNLYGSYCMNTYTLGSLLSVDEIKAVCPDIVITMNGNSVTPLKNKLLGLSGSFQHWHVSKEGTVSDVFRCQTNIIECAPSTFFEKFSELTEDESRHTYIEQWKNLQNSKMDFSGQPCKIDFSSVYAVQQTLANIPKGSLLHISNSNNVRIASYFPINESIEVFCNRGTCGIDGSMSSFIGQASVNDGLAFLMIGDLSFFYDMNAIWNRYVGKNVRILVNNNFGGALFHSSYYKQIKTYPNIDRHIAAEHQISIRGWAESRGFQYLSASNKDEFDTAMKEFVKEDSQQPIVIETFTDKEVDIRQMNVVLNSFRPAAEKNITAVASKLPEPIKRKIKKLIGKH